LNKEIGTDKLKIKNYQEIIKNIQEDLSMSKNDYEALKIYDNNLNEELKKLILLQKNTELEFKEIKSQNKE